MGDFEVTALNDGVVPYPTAQLLPTATPEQVEIALADCALKDPVGMSYNAFLINTGSKLVLIDTGTGGKLDDQPAFHGAGDLMANLRAAGYQPEQIDEIYITHLGRRLLGGRWTPDASRNRPHPNGPAALLLDPGELLAAVIA